MSVTIAPNDANIIYSPYNWNRTAARAQTINPGAYFRVALTGNPVSVAMTFDMANVGTELPQIIWRIDGGAWAYADMAASIPVTIPSTNTWGKHFLEMVVMTTSGVGSRWNSPWPNGVKFTGLTCSDGTATAPVARRPLHGLVFGDSITEGHRTLKNQEVTSFNNAGYSNSVLSWAWQLGDTLGAEIGVVGFSSQGYTKVGAGFVPAFPDAWDLLYNGQARPVTDPVAPDFIVINHGRNDALETNPAATATATWNEILAAYPSTTKIVILEVFEGRWGPELEAAVAAIGNPRLTFAATDGWWNNTVDSVDTVHPTGYANLTQIAPRAAKAVQDALASGSGVENRWIKTSTGLVKF